MQLDRNPVLTRRGPLSAQQTNTPLPVKHMKKISKNATAPQQMSESKIVLNTQCNAVPQQDQGAAGSPAIAEPASFSAKPKARRSGKQAGQRRQPIEQAPIEPPVLEPAPAGTDPLQPDVQVAELPVDEIDISKGIQCRVRHCDATITEFAEQMLAGAKFPPITVYEVEGCRVLTDGHHRLLAARKAGLNSISANVHAGTYKEALRSSIQANAKLKLNFTNEDKRESVRQALAEFQSELSHRAIAKLCCVSPGLVDNIVLEQKKVPTVGSTSTDADAQASSDTGADAVESPSEEADPEANAKHAPERSAPASEQPTDEAQEAASATARKAKERPEAKPEAKLLARIKKATPEICGEIALLLFTLDAKVGSKTALRAAFNSWLTGQVSEI